MFKDSIVLIAVILLYGTSTHCTLFLLSSYELVSVSNIVSVLD